MQRDHSADPNPIPRRRIAGRIALGAGWIALVSAGLLSCQSPAPQEIEKPLIYEGMSVEELREILGAPDSIQPGGSVYDANSERTKRVEKWFYPKRKVMVIDDTVKNPAMPRR